LKENPQKKLFSSKKSLFLVLKRTHWIWSVFFHIMPSLGVYQRHVIYWKKMNYFLPKYKKNSNKFKPPKHFFFATLQYFVFWYQASSSCSWCIFSKCDKHSILTSNIGNWRKRKFGWIESRSQKSREILHIQAALAICDFSIRGFDYSRTQKLRMTRENCYL
jgi:hypothetical protein